jgi:hypothetical protein
MGKMMSADWLRRLYGSVKDGKYYCNKKKLIFAEGQLPITGLDKQKLYKRTPTSQEL